MHTWSLWYLFPLITFWSSSNLGNLFSSEKDITWWYEPLSEKSNHLFRYAIAVSKNWLKSHTAASCLLISSLFNKSYVAVPKKLWSFLFCSLVSKLCIIPYTSARAHAFPFYGQDRLVKRFGHILNESQIASQYGITFSSISTNLHEPLNSYRAFIYTLKVTINCCPVFLQSFHCWFERQPSRWNMTQQLWPFQV